MSCRYLHCAQHVMVFITSMGKSQEADLFSHAKLRLLWTILGRKRQPFEANSQSFFRRWCWKLLVLGIAWMVSPVLLSRLVHYRKKNHLSNWQPTFDCYKIPCWPPILVGSSMSWQEKTSQKKPFSVCPVSTILSRNSDFRRLYVFFFFVAQRFAPCSPAISKIKIKGS